MRTLDFVLSSLESISRAIVVALMGAMSLVAFFAVVFRFVLQRPLAWSEELARYMMVWVTFAGAGIALSQGRQIGVTLFVDALPPRARKAALLLAELIALAFLVVAIYQGLRFTWLLRRQTSPAMGISMIVPYSAIPFGCAYMALVVVRKLLSRSDRGLSVQDPGLADLEEDER